MIVIALDPGERTGWALVVDGIVREIGDVARVDEACGILALRAALGRLPPPDLIAIEDPAPVQRGSSARARQQLQRRVGGLHVLAVLLWPGVPIRIVPSGEWQRVAHAGRVESASKDRSLGFLMGCARVGEVDAAIRTERGRVRDDAVDAACLGVVVGMVK